MRTVNKVKLDGPMTSLPIYLLERIVLTLVFHNVLTIRTVPFSNMSRHFCDILSTVLVFYVNAYNDEATIIDVVRVRAVTDVAEDKIKRCDIADDFPSVALFFVTVSAFAHLIKDTQFQIYSH